MVSQSKIVVSQSRVVVIVETRDVLRRRTIKRWVPCDDMDRRLKIPHATKVVCGFRKPSEECLSLALLLGFDWPSSYNTLLIQYNTMQYNAILIAINRAKHVCATVIIINNNMLMCNHKIDINIMLCLIKQYRTYVYKIQDL